MGRVPRLPISTCIPIFGLALLLCGSSLACAQALGYCDTRPATPPSGTLVVWLLAHDSTTEADRKPRPYRKAISASEPSDASPMSSPVREQTAGSFGVSTTNLPAAAAAANTHRIVLAKPVRDEKTASFAGSIQASYPGLQFTFLDVFDDDLFAWLDAASGTSNYPDLLFSQPPASPFAAKADPESIQRYFVSVSNSGWAGYPVQGTPLEASDAWLSHLMLLVDSPNEETARALYLFLMQRGTNAYRAVRTEADDEAAAEAAVRIFGSRLHQQYVGGEADPDLYGYDAKAVETALEASKRSGDSERLQAFSHVDVCMVHARGGSAFVALRAIESTPKNLAVIYALVVVRKGTDAGWRLLHISYNLTPKTQQAAFGHWLAATGGTSPRPLVDGVEHPLGISQASPMDGETRSRQTDLWWDNRGGAVLQVVEWAEGSDAHLFFVPDSGTHLQTRVRATFILGENTYKWRVWSVGRGGDIVLSPWRTMKIVGPN